MGGFHWIRLFKVLLRVLTTLPYYMVDVIITPSLVIGPSQITTRYIYVNNPNSCKLMIANSSVIDEVIDLDNFEIHLPEERHGYVSLSDIPPLYNGLTLCFWLNTVHSGFVIEYKVASEQNESTVLGFYYNKSTFRIHFYKKIR